MVCRLRLESQAAEPIPNDPYQLAIGQRFSLVLQHEIQWLVMQLQREQMNSSVHQQRSTPLSPETSTASHEF